ncbi:MAG: sulfotransferase [Alphaproteobacteria bacterium]|nr:sulfotransferase [Alphaproteobacteria bacterium]
MSSRLQALLPPPAVLDRLVYLVGPARGGTSILHAAQAINPRALVLPGVTHFLPQVWRYRRTAHERLLRQILRLPQAWDEPGIRVALDDAGYAEFSRLVTRAFAGRDLAMLYQLYPMAHAIAIGAMAARPGIACWHDKSNDWRYLGTLARAFPLAKFIIVVRDPRSVALSGAFRLGWHDQEERPATDPTHLVDMALYWRFMVQRSLALAGRLPLRSIVVRYEDFITEPVPTLQRLFRFTTGDEVSDARIRQGLAALPGNATNMTEQYEGLSRAPLERWKTALSAEQISLIEWVTAPVARKLGYAMAEGGGLGDLLRAASSVPGAASRLKRVAKALAIAAQVILAPPPAA